MTETLQRTAQVKRIGIREGQIGESEWQRSAMGLLPCPTTVLRGYYHAERANILMTFSRVCFRKQIEDSRVCCEMSAPRSTAHCSVALGINRAVNF
jgi:hypothetical protein